MPIAGGSWLPAISSGPFGSPHCARRPAVVHPRGISSRESIPP